MARALSTSDLARIEAATRTLLSPLAAPSVDAWRDEAMRVVSDALGAEGATFLVPGQAQLVATRQMDPWFAQVVQDETGPTWTGTGSPRQFPLLEEFHRGLRAHHVEVWDMHSADHVLGGTGVAFDNPWFHEVLRKANGADTHALFAPSARGDAMLTLHGFHRAPEPGENLLLLRVLYPSFKAGLETVGRYAAHRHALDALDRPAAAFSADGRETHRTPALAAALTADPERERVEGALRLLATALRPLAFPGAAGGAGLAPVTREVATARGRYTLRGVLLAPGAFGGTDAFLVTIEPPGGPALPTPEAVRARHGLTKRESEVALLLAEGLSNEALAERLFVSKHTARHHVEAVLAKLDVPGRAAVAARLLQPV